MKDFSSVTEAAEYYLQRWGNANSSIHRLVAWVTKYRTHLPEELEDKWDTVGNITMCNTCASVLSRWKNSLISQLDKHHGFSHKTTEGDIRLEVAIVLKRHDFHVHCEVPFQGNLGRVDILVSAKTIPHHPILIIEIKNNDSWSVKKQAESQCHRYQQATGIKAIAICCKTTREANYTAIKLALSLNQLKE